MPKPSTRNDIQNETLCDRPPIEWANCRAVLREWQSTGRIPERFADSLVQLGLVVIDEAMGGLSANDRTRMICRRADIVESILVGLDRRGGTLLASPGKKVARRR